MANNLRKGSKVFINLGHRKIEGIVIGKFTARKRSVNVPNNKRTIVHVKASGQLFVKRPNELKRRK